MLDGFDEHRVPVREGAPTPQSAPPWPVSAGETYLPQWEEPDFFAEPWEDYGEECIKYYNTPTYIYHRVIPEGSLVHIWSMSYSASDNTYTYPSPGIGTFFTIEVLRDHETLIVFKDRVKVGHPLALPPDFGNRFLFAAHHRPIPLSMIFDRRRNLSCRVTIHNGTGPIPVDPLIRFRVLFGGYRSTLTASSEKRGKQQRIDPAQTTDMVNRVMDLIRIRGGRV